MATSIIEAKTRHHKLLEAQRHVSTALTILRDISLGTIRDGHGLKATIEAVTALEEAQKELAHVLQQTLPTAS